MSRFLLNVLVALAWIALTGEFTPPNLAAGFVLGFIILWVTRRGFTETTYFTKVPNLIGFLIYFLWALVLASLRVVYEVITPGHHMVPGIIAIPLDIESDAEITILANIITLTPGTLSLDVSEDRRTLYIHAMYIDNGDVEAFKQEIKQGFEKRVREMFQ